MKWRLRASLFGRMAVATAVVGVVAVAVALAVAILMTVTVGFVLVHVYAGLLVAGSALGADGLLAPSPALFGYPAWAIFVAAVLMYLIGTYGARYLRASRGISADLEFGLPRSHPLHVRVLDGVALVLWLVAIATVGLQAIALLLRGFVVVVEALPSHLLTPVVFGISGLLGLVLAVIIVYDRLAEIRRDAVSDSYSPTPEHPNLTGLARQHARLADVPPPAVRVTDTELPETVTFGVDDGLIVVSEGLIDALDDAELSAVLAHEVAHLANHDSRVMSMALGPVLAADAWIDPDPEDEGAELMNFFFRALRWCGQFGVAFLSRGRERAADVAAAELTGSPAAVASALSTLSDVRERPVDDYRDWEQAVAVMDILPPKDPLVVAGHRTHPPVEERIEYLRGLTVEAESER